MRKSNLAKRTFIAGLALATAMTGLPGTLAQAKSSVKLSKSKISISVGKKYKLK